MHQGAKKGYSFGTQLMGKVRKEISHWVLRPFLRVYYHFRYQHLADPSKVITVNIADIKGWYSGNRYDEFTFKGQISGGDWNRKVIPIEKVFDTNEKYSSMKQRFIEHKSWEKTDLFRERYASKLEDGITVNGKTTIKELAAHYRTKVDPLYEEIKENGILTRDDDKDIDPMFIMIDENGELHYTVDGNHRLAICRVLGIKQIPVQVWKRHKKWQTIREQILSRNGQDVPDHLRQFLGHPDIRSELNG